MTSRSGKTALFIDGVNLHATAKSLGFVVDFRRLLAEFQTHGVTRAFYYSAVEDDEFSSVRPLLNWLGYNG